ncbi:MAG TPA: glycosyltransferase [Rhizomicrobium sp.]|nr:glycosyltransferase [Rhizomicrobium sp.]
MNILFVSDLHYLPQNSGGAQSLTHELALGLAGRGLRPAVLAPFKYDSSFIGLRNRALIKLTGPRALRDGFLGYPVYRAMNVLADMAAVVERFRPDVSIVMPTAAVTLAKESLRLSLPTVVYFQDVEMRQLGGDPRELTGALFATNSQFTAARYREAFGIGSTVITPLIRAERYRTVRTPEFVTLINPHPLKGLDRALAIAERCPKIQFCFVESWALGAAERQALQHRLASLPNVALHPRSADMRPIYRRTKILLAPSVWEEAWGRVVSEAQLNGIPVIASRRGGLPEAVGPGGVLIDPDAADEVWTEAVRSLWCDQKRYDELSAAALSYSGRPEMNPDRQLDALLQLMRATTDGRHARDIAP